MCNLLLYAQHSAANVDIHVYIVSEVDRHPHLAGKHPETLGRPVAQTMLNMLPN